MKSGMTGPIDTDTLVDIWLPLLFATWNRRSTAWIQMGIGYTMLIGCIVARLLHATGAR